jgi:protein-S-isoprenylcysteine O-methyltransferase Ste14
MHLKIPPALVAVLIIVMMVIISKWLPQFSFALPYKFLVATGVAIPGISIAAAGVLSFRRLQTTVNPTKPGTASTLAIDGIYRWSRNPMYLGILLFVIACGIYSVNLVALISGPVAFVAYMSVFQIKPEEDALTLIFGDDFVRYKSRVRRWL